MSVCGYMLGIGLVLCIRMLNTGPQDLSPMRRSLRTRVYYVNLALQFKTTGEIKVDTAGYWGEEERWSFRHRLGITGRDHEKKK